MDVNLNSLSYDLAQNYIFGLKLTKLEDLCALSIVSLLFKREDIISEIKSLELKYINEFEDEWTVVVRKVEKMALEFVVLEPLQYLVKKVISFTASEIHMFLLKNRLFDSRLFLENFVYTTQGTINTKKTVLEVLKNSDLTVELKFEMACYYFVETSVIRDCFREVPYPSWKELLTRVNGDLDKSVPIIYWYCYFRDKNSSELERYLNNSFKKLEPILENPDNLGLFNNLLLWAIYCVNDAAFYFLCQRPKDQLNLQIFLKKLFRDSSFGVPPQYLSNIYVYLYFNIGNLTSFSNMKNIFLEMILSHQWINLSNKFVKEYQEFYKNWDYLFILRNIVSILCTSLRKKLFARDYKKILKEFIGVVPSTTKCYLMNEVKEDYFSLVKSLLYERDKESVENLLCIGIPERFFENTDIFLQLLKEKEFTLIDQCMMRILRSKSAIVLKQKIFLRNANEVCNKFILDNDWNSVHSFIKWGSSFCSIRDRINLEISIPFYSNGKVISEILFNSDIKIKGCRFKFADTVLYCCLGRKDFVSLYKKRAILTGTDIENVNQSANFYQEIKNCVLKGKLKFLNKLFFWASCSLQEVKSVKQKLKNDEEFLDDICQKNIKLLHSFVAWCKYEKEAYHFGRKLFNHYRNHLRQKSPLRNLKLENGNY
ncbi:UNVERIFIED_CONTAM: hypothetical protein RMT77_011339 [Armadillidium vulgare]